MARAVENAFSYGKLVLATTTYNADIFPFMKYFIEHLTARNYQKRTIGFIENGSWAPTAARVMKGMFEDSQQKRTIGFIETGSWAPTAARVMKGMFEDSQDLPWMKNCLRTARIFHG